MGTVGTKPVMMRAFLGLLLAALFLVNPVPAAAERATDASAQPVVISHFTGKPVPRFERLKANKVYGRAGPSFDHPVLWQYERKGLPVLVIKESIAWRRVRDPDGDEVWIHHSLLSGGASALVTRETVLRRTPNETAGAVLRAEQGVVAALLTCDGGWCRIGLDRQKGWVPADALWGAQVPGDPL